MKNVEEKNVVVNEITNLERLIEERVEENTTLFNEEEKELLENNKNLIKKIYLLGILDML